MAEEQNKKTWKILLVDDYEPILKANTYWVSDVLEDAGYAKSDFCIDTSVNGDLALKKVESNGFYDAIISDYDMPFNGVKLYIGLKNLEQQKRVVFITGNADGLRKELSTKLENKDYKEPLILEKMKDGFYESLRNIILEYLR